MHSNSSLVSAQCAYLVHFPVIKAALLNPHSLLRTRQNAQAVQVHCSCINADYICTESIRQRLCGALETFRGAKSCSPGRPQQSQCARFLWAASTMAAANSIRVSNGRKRSAATSCHLRTLLTLSNQKWPSLVD